MKLYEKREIQDVIETLKNLLNAEHQELGKEVNKLKQSYSTAQADWEDTMRGSLRKKEKDTSIFRQLCKTCGQTINGNHLDHDIYRFKCMDCGCQWHAKREVRS